MIARKAAARLPSPMALTMWMTLMTLTALLNSCMPQASLPELRSRPEQKTLAIWLWQGNGMEKLIEDYSQLRPDIDVETVYVRYEDVVPKLLSSFASRSGAPDLVLLDADQIGEAEAFRGYFHNLYDFGADRNRYLDWKREQAELDEGRFLFGLPADIGPVAIAYRHDLFAEAGLPSGREEAAEALSDWETLEQWGLKLRREIDVALVDNVTSVYTASLHEYSTQPASRSGSGETDKDGRLALIRKAWDRAVRFHSLGLSAGLPSRTPDWARGAVEGRYAAVIGPSWLHGAMKTNAPATFGKWDMIRTPEGPSIMDGTFLAVPATSRYPEEAYALADWLTSPDRQLDGFLQSGNFPSTPRLYGSPELSGLQDPFFNNAPTGQIYTSAVLHYRGPAIRTEQRVRTIEGEAAVREALRRLESENADPERLWAEAEKQIAGH
ncbi:ABC transporter substrate-binding protein [Paenibacillus cisolokensis]|uniref:ABC transporter substrate-binding protein n=1 Tax=Paenibacillus cisolokensis TaxID=1658519 RepID=UPI003D2AB505